MGASSVTGVGKGAAEPNRGPGNNRNNYVSLLDPHVVYSGKLPATGGVATINLPSHLKDLPENLTCLVSSKAIVLDKNLDGDGLVESFSVGMSKKLESDFVIIKDPSSNFSADLTP